MAVILCLTCAASGLVSSQTHPPNILFIKSNFITTALNMGVNPSRFMPLDEAAIARQLSKNGVNDPPFLEPINEVRTAKGTQLNILAVGTDFESDNIDFEINDSRFNLVELECRSDGTKSEGWYDYNTNCQSLS